MKELYNIISEETLLNMIEIEPSIKELEEIEVKEKIDILKEINCSITQIVDIIGSNPHYLNRENSDILKLIQLLLKYGFNTLNILFDSNPYILNLDNFEIEDYVNSKINNGELLEDIVDNLEDNPLLFNEI